MSSPGETVLATALIVVGGVGGAILLVLSISCCCMLSDRSRHRRKARLRQTQIQNKDFSYLSIASVERKIRLLRILSGSSPEIYCELFDASLDDRSTRYEALSYRWSSDTDLATISLNKTRFYVCPNLGAALEHLRQPAADRIVWIDAICINQMDSAEKGSQVALMKDIYTRASGVFVWLGRANDYSQRAIGFLNEAERHEHPEDWLRSTIGQDDYKKPWVSIRYLLENEYWTRIWIVQELVCASTITVHCGSYSCDWKLLVAADSSWKDKKLLKPDLSEWNITEEVPAEQVPHRVTARRYLASLLTLGAYGFSGGREYQAPRTFVKPPIGPQYFQAIRMSQRDSDDRKSLFELMCFHATSKATIPRDKIFALVGIGADTSNGGYKIDYACLEDEVALNFVDFMVTKARSLDFLCFPIGCLPARSAKFQSSNDEFFLIMGAGIVPQKGMRFSKYAAAGATSPDVQVVQTRSTTPFKKKSQMSMKIQGVAVDKIAAFMDDLTNTDAQYIPSFRPLRIKWLQRFGIFLFIISNFIIGVITFFYVLFVVIVQCGSITAGLGPTEVPKVRSFDITGHWLTRMRDLKFQPTNPSYQLPPPDSSDWIEKPHLIELLNRIKLYLYFALKSSAPSSQDPDLPMDEDERIMSLFRTIIGNRTIQGSQPPSEWRKMFDVLINGPSCVPLDFAESNTVESRALFNHSLVDDNTTSLSTTTAVNRRAQTYVYPLIEAIIPNLSNRKLFITTTGRLGATDKGAKKGDLVSVFMGCSFLVVVQASMTYRWRSWRRGTFGKAHEAGKGEKSSSSRSCRAVMHGTAYLDGFMDGQGINDLDKGNNELTTFELY